MPSKQFLTTQLQFLKIYFFKTFLEFLKERYLFLLLLFSFTLNLKFYTSILHIKNSKNESKHIGNSSTIGSDIYISKEVVWWSTSRIGKICIKFNLIYLTIHKHIDWRSQTKNNWRNMKDSIFNWIEVEENDSKNE